LTGFPQSGGKVRNRWEFGTKVMDWGLGWGQPLRR
jgi:hypothetical protein